MNSSPGQNKNETMHDKKKVITERIVEAEELYKSSELLSHICGYKKLLKKIKAEINFLDQLQQSSNFRPEHLHSSNLNNLSAIVHVVKTYSGIITAVYYPVKCEINGRVHRQLIDIVADNGKTWIKVIARNPFALERICSGDAEFGVRTVVDQAEDLLMYSQQNLHHFVRPKIVFHFLCGLTEFLLQKLTKTGVQVHGNVLKSKLCVSDDDTESCDSTNEVEPPQDTSPNINCLNLDISTMICYVSALTNGGSHYTFHEPILNEEAEAERSHPVKPILDDLFKGKILCSCETAISDFKRIVCCVGGPEEARRADELLTRVKMIPDEISPMAQSLVIAGRIKKRSQIIFGTGDSMQALTVTANSAFVRATAVKGIKFAVFEHEARALSEKKQLPV